MKKTGTYLEAGLLNSLARARGKLLKIYLMLHGCQVGRGLKCSGWPLFRSVPEGNIRIGDNVNFGKRISLDISREGMLQIGNSVNLTQDVVIASASSVQIGEKTLIGEYVSIRDADHRTLTGMPILTQELHARPVTIGCDVWIGAGCRILKGTKIPDGAIIGANGVVLAGSVIEPNGIHAGCPVRLLRKR